MTLISELHEEWMQDEAYRLEYQALNEEFAALHAKIGHPSQTAATQDQPNSPISSGES